MQTPSLLHHVALNTGWGDSKVFQIVHFNPHWVCRLQTPQSHNLTSVQSAFDWNWLCLRPEAYNVLAACWAGTGGGCLLRLCCWKLNRMVCGRLWACRCVVLLRVFDLLAGLLHFLVVLLAHRNYSDRHWWARSPAHHWTLRSSECWELQLQWRSAELPRLTRHRRQLAHSHPGVVYVLLTHGNLSIGNTFIQYAVLSENASRAA